MRFDRFRVLLKEADITFLKPFLWRDSKRRASGRGKKYRYQRRLLTMPQIVEASGCVISLVTLRYRLGKE